ncbi:hypothetical protein ACQ4PT_018325 [Festuca glaucescens]
MGNLHGGTQQNVIGEPARGEISSLGPGKEEPAVAEAPWPAARDVWVGRRGCGGEAMRDVARDVSAARHMGAVETGCAGGELPAGGRSLGLGGPNEVGRVVEPQPSVDFDAINDPIFSGLGDLSRGVTNDDVVSANVSIRESLDLLSRNYNEDQSPSKAPHLGPPVYDGTPLHSRGLHVYDYTHVRQAIGAENVDVDPVIGAKNVAAGPVIGDVHVAADTEDARLAKENAFEDSPAEEPKAVFHDEDHLCVTQNFV